MYPAIHGSMQEAFLGIPALLALQGVFNEIAPVLAVACTSCFCGHLLVIWCRGQTSFLCPSLRCASVPSVFPLLCRAAALLSSSESCPGMGSGCIWFNSRAASHELTGLLFCCTSLVMCFCHFCNNSNHGLLVFMASFRAYVRLTFLPACLACCFYQKIICFV